MRSAVRNVAKYFPTAIISGRSRDKVVKCSLIEGFFVLSIYIHILWTPSVSDPLHLHFFQVYDLVGLTELYYAGSHGMDIMGPLSHTVSDDPNCVESNDQQVSDDKIFYNHPFY